VEAERHWGGRKQKEDMKRNGEREMMQRRDRTGRDMRGGADTGGDAKAGDTDAELLGGSSTTWQRSRQGHGRRASGRSGQGG
jgi:hypothetical protein